MMMMMTMTTMREARSPPLPPSGADPHRPRALPNTRTPASGPAAPRPRLLFPDRRGCRSSHVRAPRPAARVRTLPRAA
jgi:hypothetical protein